MAGTLGSVPAIYSSFDSPEAQGKIRGLLVKVCVFLFMQDNIPRIRSGHNLQHHRSADPVGHTDAGSRDRKGAGHWRRAERGRVPASEILSRNTYFYR